MPKQHKKTKRLLITGGSGLLGSSIVRLASGFEVYATFNTHATEFQGCKFAHLDIKNKTGTISLVESIRPEVIIHTAALRSLDYCEGHPDEAWAINTEGAENIALGAAEVQAKLIHTSTDSVFDGIKGMFNEEDIPNPVTIYGETKLEGEIRVRRLVDNALIVRTSSIYGRSLHGQSIAEWILSQIKQGVAIKMFSDAFFSPILADNLAEAILEMYERDLRGIYHVAGGERCNRFTFAMELARVFGLDEKLVQPSKMSDTEVKLRAPRPRDSSLDVGKVSREISTPLPGVREGLTKFRKLIEA